MSLAELWKRSRSGAAERWLGAFAAFIVLLFFADMATAPWRPLLPVYVERELLRKPLFTSNLVSLQTVFGAIAGLVGGGLANRLGRKRVMLIGLTGLPLVGLAFMLHSTLALVAIWVYFGFVNGLFIVGRQTYMMAIVPASYLGMATALQYMGSTLGNALGNALAGPLVDSRGFAALGLAIIVIAVVVLVAGTLAMPEMQPLSSAKAEAPLGSYASTLRRWPVLALGVLRFVPTCYWGTATLLVPLLIYRAAHVPSSAAYYGTASLLFASGCQLVAGRVCDRFGRRWVVVVLTSLIVAISLATAAFSRSLVGLYVCGILGAGIAWSMSVTIPGLVTDVSPQGEHARTLGFSHVAWSGGMLLGTQVAGWLVNVNGGLPFLIMGLLNLTSVATAIALGRWTARGAYSISAR